MAKKAPKKEKTRKLNLILILLIIIILALGYIIGFSVIEKHVKQNLNKDEICKQEKGDYKIKYEGFSFTIPEEYQHEIYNGNLIISNKVKGWDAVFNIVNKDYENIYKNRENIDTKLKEKSISTKNVKERTVAGTTYITAEISSSGEKGLLAISNLSTNFVAVITITDEENDINYDVLEELSPIIKKSVYYGDAIVSTIDKFSNSDINSSL